MPDLAARFVSAGLLHYGVLAAALFSLGLYTVLTRRNAVAVLMGIELILNSANIYFAAFGRFLFPVTDPRASAMAIFVILLAAAEAVIFLAIVLAMYRQTQTVNVDEADRLRF
mgnify:FL=1